MNALGNYTGRYPNRRCRRAFYADRPHLYFYHYRESWRRYVRTDKFREDTGEIMGTPVQEGEFPTVNITITPSNQ